MEKISRPALGEKRMTKKVRIPRQCPFCDSYNLKGYETMGVWFKEDVEQSILCEDCQSLVYGSYKPMLLQSSNQKLSTRRNPS